MYRKPDVLADSAAQVARKRSLVLDGGMHVGLEEHEAAAPLLLGPVESEVGVAQKVARSGGIAWEQHDADAGLDGDLATLEGDRAGERSDHLTREALDRGSIAALRYHDRELVAAEAGEEMVLWRERARSDARP